MAKLLSAISDLLRAVAGSEDRIRPTSAIIVAAGSSTRMGNGISKQLLSLDNIPVVARTIAAFDNCEYISEIIVVAKKEEFPYYKEFAKTYKFKKLTKLVSGGATRQESVKNGFSAIDSKSRFVAIHDGARCLITPDQIRDVCRVAYKVGAATAATRSVDSVKLSNGKNLYIDSTADRDRVWLAQTPQVFKTEIYQQALVQAEIDNLSATDDNALVENLGCKVRLVECGKENIKITNQSDVHLALAILRTRETEKGDTQ